MLPATKDKMRRENVADEHPSTPLQVSLESNHHSGHVTRYILTSADHGAQKSSYVAVRWATIAQFSHQKREKESRIPFIPKCGACL